MKTFPLTQTQVGMYLDFFQNMETVKYNLCFSFRFPKEVDSKRLAQALRISANQISVFHLRLIEIDGEIRQYLSDEDIVVQYKEMPDSEIPEAQREFLAPYDPFHEANHRFCIVETPTSIYLFLCYLHLFFDGTTVTAFYRFLSSVYQNPEAKYEEAVSFVDYAVMEPDGFQTEKYKEVSAELLKKFQGLSMTFPTDYWEKDKNIVRKTPLFYEENQYIDCKEVNALCRQKGFSPNLFFMGAFALALGSMTTEKKVVFCTGYHGRKSPELKQTCGAMISLLPVLGEINGSLTLADYLNTFKIHNAGVYPFTHFCKETGMQQGFSFVYQTSIDAETITLDGISSDECISLYPGGTTEDCCVEVYQKGERYQLKIRCLPGKYSHEFVVYFLNLYTDICKNFLSHSDDYIKDIPVLSPEKIANILALSKGEEVPYNSKRVFTDLIHYWATATPDATAVVDCDGCISYGELERQANTLASLLIDYGVAPGSFVGLMLPRRVSFIVALLAVQKAGAGYVPMDSEYPQERLEYMLDNSEAPVLITTESILKEKRLQYSGTTLFIELLGLETGAEKTFDSLATPDTPAYMIYTSGSTGRPKGVVISQRALSALLGWINDELKQTSTSVCACHPSFSFDASVICIFPVLATGGVLHIFSEELRKDLEAMNQYIRQNKIQGATLSTQIGLAMLNTYPDLPLDYLMLGGEKILPFADTEITVYNGYGPTEFTVISSFQKVAGNQTGDIPIGRPIPNSYSLVVNQLGQPMPEGFAGELALVGSQISDGYWKLPEKNASAFVPCSILSGKVMYRTGDLARYNNEKTLDYLGRIDSQVKLRGFRIEIGEIEYAAASMPGINQVAAEIKEIFGTRHLVLYYEGTVDSQLLKAKMTQSLTEYMVPDYFVQMEAMPLTPNGKIDRKKLPLPNVEAEPVIAPKNDLEKKILDIASQILGRNDFGVTHNLINCGLTSLGAMALIAKLNSECGVRVTIKELMQKPQICLIAELFDRIPQQQSHAVAEGHPKRSWYPLTENQRGIYSDCLLNPNTTQYNVPFVLRFKTVSAQVLQHALATIIDKHPVFKSRFGEQNGNVVLLRGDERSISIETSVLPDIPDQRFFNSLVAPFALENEDLIRLKVFSAPDGTYLFFDAHHIFFDGYSLGVFLAELKRALNENALDGETYSSFDYALDERDYMESQQLLEDDGWFDRYLDDASFTVFPNSTNGTGEQPGKAGKLEISIDGSAICSRCSKQGITQNDYFLTVLTELLYRIIREDRIMIATVTSGRTKPETAHSIGMFVRTLPLLGISKPLNFSDALQKMHASMLDLLEHESYSFARLAERHNLHPEILFAYEGGIFQLDESMTLTALENSVAKMPLAITVTPQENKHFILSAEYDASRYSSQDMNALLVMYKNLAQGLAETDDLKTVPLLCGNELEQSKKLCWGNSMDYDRNKTFVQYFLEAATRNPDLFATFDADGKLTYGEADRMSNTLAVNLVQNGVTPGKFVALMLPRRNCFIVSMLAVQKTGAGYVPLDADYPDDRISYMLNNSEAPVLLTTRELFRQKNLDTICSVIFYDDCDFSGAERPIDFSTPSTPAYMIYTSGSTGKPKGVVILQRAISAMISWSKEAFEIAPGSSMAGHPSFCFDGANIALFPCLAFGGEFHIFSEKLRKDLQGMYDYIVEHKLKNGSFSTQIGLELINTFPDLPMKYIMVGGEKILPFARTSVQVLNGYGPTEFTVCSSYYPVNQEIQEEIPIGRPVPNSYSFIVDRYGYLLPQGYCGEIALAGEQIAEGYWQLPEKTEAVFVSCPHLPGKKMYKTGDLGRYREDGQMEYLGRLDFQVKLRGFRIEFGEIEHCAACYPGIVCVAAEVKELNGGKHLILYFCSDKLVDTEKLKAYMAASLTEYMVPDYFVQLEKMPQTPGGKINRKQLPLPNVSEAKREYVAPVSQMEECICNVYGDVLSIEKYGVTDDFFLSGGTSLVAIRAIVALQKAGLQKIVYADLFKYKTPRQLADFLQQGEQKKESGTQAFDYGAYDYSQIDRLLENTSHDLFDEFTLRPLGNVLLTGVTGYLGIHLLKYLLDTTQATIYALIRPKQTMTPERRMISDFVFYFGELPSKHYLERIVCIKADITDADLEQKLAVLPIQTVFNCAAMVKHFVADNLIEKVNVEGVRNLIHYCINSGVRLIHTSTYSIGGTIPVTSSALLDEHHLYIGQESDNDYIRTKFLAERFVLQAIATQGLDGKIMRLGNLMGRERDGEFQINTSANAFINSLKSYRVLGAYPLDNMAQTIEMSPIDRVAEAIVLLATTPASMVIFQPSNAYKLDMGTIMSAMNRRGWQIDYVSKREFAAQVEALRNNPESSRFLQGILHYTGHILQNRRFTETNNFWTTTVLYKLGFRWKQTGDRYLDSFFDMLEGLSVFDIDMH